MKSYLIDTRNDKLVRFYHVCLTTAILFSSCSGNGSTLDPTGTPLGPPQIEVVPRSINFSLLEGTRDTVSIKISNAGGFPLEVTSISSVSNYITPMFPAQAKIDMGGSLEVSFAIDASELSPSTFQGTVEISSNDKDNPTVIVTINLNVTALPEPEIDVSPLNFDLTLAESESDTIFITLSNLGSANLIVTGITSNVNFITPQTAAVEIEPGNSVDVPVEISSSELEPGTFQGVVEIISNDPDEPSIIVTVNFEVIPAGPFPPTFSAIQENVFTVRCALSGCHSGAAPAAGMSLQAGSAFGNLVGVPSTEVSSLLRINPGNPDDSYLIIKIVETDPRRVGNRMPRNGPPFLDEDVIEVIRNWIADGAQDN